MALKILIIKLGAMGDVVRTTALLRVLKGQIYWITKKKNLPLLKVNKRILNRAVDVGEAEEFIKGKQFDLVLSLDDDFVAAKLATKTSKIKLIGAFINSVGKIDYTKSSSRWFDMGLISKFGKKRADILKKKNRLTYQEILFKMIGNKFRGEEYLLNYKKKRRNGKKKTMLIGIECRADKRWPSKKWNKYEDLGNAMLSEGLCIKFFKHRDSVKEYVKDISECDMVVTGDTLAMHLALALKIKVVSVFICTSSYEIYDYGRMIKVVSPLLEKAFYRNKYVKNAVEAVSLDSVYSAVKKLI